MQISKLLPVICAVTVCASFISVRAQDNPAQAAARAALMEKMGELDAQQSRPGTPIVVTPSGATVVVPPHAAAAEPTNPPAVSKPIETPEPAPTVAEPPMKPVGGEAVTKTQSDAQKQAVLAAEKKAADAQAKADAQKAAQAKKDAALAEKKRAADEAKAAKIQKQKMAEAEKQRADAEKAAESAAGANDTGKELGLKPIAAPALPISAAKHEQLQALLAKYRADQITPAEYQAQRAEILAQP